MICLKKDSIGLFYSKTFGLYCEIFGLYLSNLGTYHYTFNNGTINLTKTRDYHFLVSYFKNNVISGTDMMPTYNIERFILDKSLVRLTEDEMRIKDIIE